MQKINYQKIYEQLLEEHPHNLEAFKSLAKYYPITLSKIIYNSKWSIAEKYELLTYFGYTSPNIMISDNNEIEAWAHCIEADLQDSFSALIRVLFEVDEQEMLKRIPTYNYIVASIVQGNMDREKKLTYLKSLLQHTPEPLLNEMFKTKYKATDFDFVLPKNTIVEIISMGDLDLIKKYLPKVENISLFLSDAVSTGNIEIVDYFLSQGADINYTPEEPIIRYLSPIKTAIHSNDLAMFKYLESHGANLDLREKEEDFKQKILHPNIEVEFIYDRAIPTESTFSPTLSQEAKVIKYRRYSTPLEYASDIVEIDPVRNSNLIDITFGINDKNSNNCISLKVSDSSKTTSASQRQEIIDSIYSSLSEEEQKNVNYQNLIIFTFISRTAESFKKYTDYVLKSKLQDKLNPKELTEKYLIFNRNNPENVDGFVQFMKSAFPEYNVIKELLVGYVHGNIRVFSNPEFRKNELTSYLLNQLTAEELKNISLMPYCVDLEGCNLLLEKGISLEQQDEQGNTLLLKLCMYGSNADRQLKDYLLQNANLSHRNKNNRLALFYVMKNALTDDARRRSVAEAYAPFASESFVIDLINAMPKKAVCCPSIMDMLNSKYYITSVPECDFDTSSHLYIGEAYLHEDVFKALNSKGCLFGNELFKKILTHASNRALDRREENSKLEALAYEILDDNTSIQTFNLQDKYKEINRFFKELQYYDVDILEIKKRLTEFNEMIKSCKEFKETEIPAKKDSEAYKEYAKRRYGIDYDSIDELCAITFINAVTACGEIDAVTDLLNVCTELNINIQLNQKSINMCYSAYLSHITEVVDWDEDDEPIFSDRYFPIDCISCRGDEIIFSGGLIQFAQLSDNIELAKLLTAKGVSANYMEDGEDLTFKYVHSYPMKAYIEEITSKRTYNDLVGEEVDFYNSLITDKKNPYQKKKSGTDKNSIIQ